MRRRRVLVVVASVAAMSGAGALAVPGGRGAWAAPAARVATVWATGSWGRAIPVPGLGALNTGGHAVIRRVSCGSPGNCAAGGSYRDRHGHGQGFVVAEQNGRWGRAIRVPGLATLNKGEQAWVISVSCGSAGNCAAGGYYRDASRRYQGFVATEQNGVWGHAIEVPGLGALNSIGKARVYSVSCGSAGNCAAGGYYSRRAGFVAVEQNGVWGRAIKVPGLAALSAGGRSAVTSVSCSPQGYCAAGGHYENQNRHQKAFVAVEQNGVWGRAIEVPGLHKYAPAGIYSVSCPSAGNCAAGGDAGGRGFVVSEHNGAWSKAIRPRLGARPGGPAEIVSVSCAPAGGCAAGGNGQSRAFVVSEHNGVWGMAIEVPGLGALTKGRLAEVSSVSCASPGSCTAAGSYVGRQQHSQGFVAVERNGRWGRAIEVPGLGALNMGGNAGVYSVSCPTPGTCAAGGSYRDRSGHLQGFVVNQTG